MILAALNDYYRRLAAAGGDDAPPPYGFAVQKVAGAIQLDRDGRFLGLVPLDLKDAKGKSRPRPMLVPQPPGRTSGVEAAFLCDNGGYLLGRDLKGKADRALRQYEAAAALHRDLLADLDDPWAQAVVNHFRTWDSAAADLGEAEALLAGWLVFLIEDTFVHDRPAVRDRWLRHVAGAGSAVLGQCLVTGTAGVPVARTHPAIKGAGGQSSGTLLVSFNFPAAEHYGKEQSFNAPVGEDAAFGYAAALNRLLSSDRKRSIGDMSVVMWAGRPCAAEDLMMQLFDPVGLSPDDDAPPEAVARAKAVRDALDRITRGQMPVGFEADEDVEFYVLGLSPNAARLSVRLWLVSTLGELVKNVETHQRDLALVTDGPNRAPWPALWTLVNETRAKDQDGRARGRTDADKRFKLHGDLLRAAVTGGPYPAALLPELLARFRADGHITHPRVALLKAVTRRLFRPAAAEEERKGELPVDYDQDFDSVGYRLGRLFAVLEGLQRSAHGRETNASVADKYISAFSATPLSLYGHLLGNSKTHLKKLGRDKERLARWYENQIQDCVVAIGPVPEVLSLEEQALFYLGYYQWKHRKGSPAQNAATATEETI